MCNFPSDTANVSLFVQEKPEACTVKAEKGDQVKVHYRGTLEDGEAMHMFFFCLRGYMFD